MKFSKCILVVLLLITNFSIAQTIMPDGRIRLLTTVVNGDTLPLVYLPTVEVNAPLTAEAAAKLKSYLKLRRDVLKAYPYAKLASIKLKLINDSIAQLPNEKQKKVFVKRVEAELKSQFEKDLKKLTITQGRILIKLIDRETGSSSYSLVKELRGNLSAFFWQGLARLFGSNLKTEYDAAGVDVQIEGIVKQIEAGELQPAALK